MKLSNGILSPIFALDGNTPPDEGGRVNRIIQTDVTDEQIRKVEAAGWKRDSPYMKRLSLFGEDNSNIAHAETEDGGGHIWDVNVPENSKLVGIFGHIGGDNVVKAI